MTMNDDKRLRWSACLLGFGLGGFFDGILLHQILQWHHLLDTVRTGFLADLRGQVLADGLFHGAMYLVTLAGLWLAWKARFGALARVEPRHFLARLLAGFGLWHVVDAVLSHWLLGIHHIRMDVDNVLLWDVLWLAVFGLVPLGVAAVLLGQRTASGEHRSAAKPDIVLPSVLAIVVAAAGAAAAWPAPAGQGSMAIVLRQGVDAGRLLVALSGSDARLVWMDRAGTVLVVQPQHTISIAQLYRAGALYVSGSVLPAGCSAWLTQAGNTPRRKA